MAMHRVSEHTARRLDHRLAREQATGRLPSVVAGLVRDGTLVWSGAAGQVDGAPPTSDTQYRIGSITKMLVAVCVLRLRDEGQLDLAEPASRHVPDAPAASATIAQLLCHASGLRSETPGAWWERTAGGDWPALTDLFAGDEVVSPPGRRFHYSNPGYAVLGELVARRRGAPWQDVVRREVLEPLGMTRTTTRPEPPAAPGLAVHPWADAVLAEPEHDAGAMAPAGQLWATLDDLARWAAFLGGANPEVLSPATLDEMTRPVALDDRPGLPWTAAYGLGVQVYNLDGRRYLGHGGSMPGFLAGVRVDAEDGDGVVVMTNATTGLGPALQADLLAVLEEEQPRAPAPWRPEGVGPGVIELVGIWYWGPAPLVLTAEGGEDLDLRPLEPRGGFGRGSRFRRLDESTWIGLDAYYAGETLRVVRHGDGSLSHLDLGSFVLTATPYDPTAEVPGGVDPDGWH